MVSWVRQKSNFILYLKIKEALHVLLMIQSGGSVKGGCCKSNFNVHELYVRFSSNSKFCEWEIVTSSGWRNFGQLIVVTVQSKPT